MTTTSQLPQEMLCQGGTMRAAGGAGDQYDRLGCSVRERNGWREAEA